jgi:hypothetical protein
MRTKKNYSIKSVLWLVATVLLIAVALSSCKTTVDCDAYGNVKKYKKL